MFNSIPFDNSTRLAKYTSDKYSTPIIFKAIYNLKPKVVNASTSRVFCALEQASFPFSTYYNSPLYFSLNKRDDKTHYACVTELQPGFGGVDGFSALSLPLTKGLENGHTVINVINFNCSGSLKSAKTTNDAKDSEKITNIEESSFKPLLFPNPTNGILTIRANSKNPLHSVSVFNSLGKKVLNIDNLNETSKKIDLSGLPVGSYFINMVIGNKIYDGQIILSK